MEIEFKDVLEFVGGELNMRKVVLDFIKSDSRSAKEELARAEKEFNDKEAVKEFKKDVDNYTMIADEYVKVLEKTLEKQEEMSDNLKLIEVIKEILEQLND